MRNEHNIMVEDLEGMKPIRKTRRRRRDNTDVDLKGGRCLHTSQDRQVVGAWEYGDKHEVPHESGKHLWIITCLPLFL